MTELKPCPFCGGKAKLRATTQTSMIILKVEVNDG